LVSAFAGGQVKEFENGAGGVEKREKDAADAEEIDPSFDKRRPTKNMIEALSSGKSGISQMWERK